MGVYVYCIKENYTLGTSIKGRVYENDWFKLEPDGSMTVKGTHGNGYSWDGCSPKWKLNDMFFGTPEAVLNYATRKSKTYYASLVHDVLYQFSRDIRYLVMRKQADREFYTILKRDGFKMALLYYWGVRSFGWIWWGRR
ncbi:MAG: DUF1353 domain-containing protein [Candidatus Omnitrophica bacterium]|nr:DUF1353 domain-containing protein [Candidatus Omnitrophota bacterium]